MWPPYLIYLSTSFFLYVRSAPLQGHLLLYLDVQCTQPSAINPTISLDLSTCLITPGVSGLVVQNQPSCTSGNATLIMYEDTACVNAIDADTSSGCFFDFPDVEVPAVMFSCQDVKDDPPASSTSTVSAASTKPAAKTSSTSYFGPAITASSTISSSSTTPTSAPSSRASSSNSDSGLSQSGQVALGVGLPVAAIVVAILAWCWPKPWSKKRKNNHAKISAPQVPPVPPRWI